MWEKIETYIVVTVIAVLIWLYAEGEMLQTYDRIPVRVQLEGAPGEDLIIEPGGPIDVLLTVRASASQYARLKRVIEEEGQLVITVPDTQGAEHVETLRERLMQTPLGDLGVNIEAVDPPTVALQTEQRVELTLPVTVRTGDLELAGSPNIEPSEATVRVPASAAEQLRELRLEARLDTLADIRSLETNVPHDVALRLHLPIEVAKAQITPARVNVRFTIERRTDTARLPRVRVVTMVLPSVAERFDIVVPQENQILRDIVVRGPVDTIARLESGEEEVLAVLSFLSSEDLRPGTDRRLPELRLPAGVSLDSQLERVEFEVRRRTTNALPPPAPPDLPATLDVPNSTAPAPQ